MSLRVRMLFFLAGTIVVGPALPAGDASAQFFVRVTTAGNPINADPPVSPGIIGASWVDVDGDGRPDLFINQRRVYRNLGGGNFERMAGPLGQGGTISNSWADYDNDGDPDLFVTGPAPAGGSYLFRNDGGGTFVKVLEGDAADTLGNAGWAPAWGDYDNDSYADLVVANAFAPRINRLLHNDAGTLVRDDGTDVTTGAAPYTIPSWSDWDQDGDVDLSIGAGPANGTVGPDYLYRNLTQEGGSPRLQRILDAPLATDLRDGQVWNWIDYDNDGDLDVYVTNWRGTGAIPNDLYRNEGGTFVKQTGAEAGIIVTDAGACLSSVWGDYDNDGDLDVLVTRGSSSLNRYYINQGDGSFALGFAVGNIVTDTGPHTGACAADFDDDGDLDLFTNSSSTVGKALWRNELPAGNHWLKVRLVGVMSNRSALGARVRVRATIGGVSVWMMREVSAQNSFGGHNDFTQHFGLGDATGAESVVVEWPSGTRDEIAFPGGDRTLTIVEGSTNPTPALFAPIGGTHAGGKVTVEWMVRDLEAPFVTVERRENEGVFLPIAHLAPDGENRVRYADGSVRAGSTYIYRLAVDEPDGLNYSDEIRVAIPALHLAVRPLSGNPVRSGEAWAVRFTLPAADPARVDVFDTRGRRVGTRVVAPGTAGEHDEAVTFGGRLSPGLYWIRVVQGAARAEIRIVVIP